MSQFLDTFYYKYCVFLHKSTILVFWPTFIKAYAFALLGIDTISRYTGFNVVLENKVIANANVELDKAYIMRVQNESASVDAHKQHVSVANSESMHSEDTKILSSIAEVEVSVLQSAQHSLQSSDLDSEMGSNISISNRQNMGLIVIVYGSPTLVYIQLMLLAAFLQTAYTPPGLVFLVTSLGIIGVIVFKVSVQTILISMSCLSNCLCFRTTTPTSSPATTPTSSRSSSSTDLLKGIENVTPTKPDRLNRSATRRFLYFHNKTLSKIKLL